MVQMVYGGFHKWGTVYGGFVNDINGDTPITGWCISCKSENDMDALGARLF